MINFTPKKIVLLPFLLVFVLSQVFANSTNPADMVLTVTIDGQDLPCNGGFFGAAFAVPDGGLPPYDYLWSNGKTNQLNDFLTVGTYSVTVTDDAGATATASVDINQPEPIVLDNVSIVDEDCWEENGAIYVDISGGVPPYKFKWADGSTDEDLVDVSDGDYTLVVTDAQMCDQKFGPFRINSDCNPTGPCDDGPVLNDASVNDADCDISNGSIFLSISNDALPHQFAWSNNADTEDIMNLAPGTYTLTLTDANDCSQVFGPYEIEDKCDEIPCLYQPELIDVVITDADCGLNNGAINITVTGQDTPFVFVWNNGMTTEDISGLEPGTYGVVVTDTEGCSIKFGGLVVKEDCTPDPPCIAPEIASVVVIESTCDNATGQAFVNLVGGPQGYNFNWSPAVSNGFSADALEAGTYTVTITNTQDPDCNLIEVFTVGNSDGPQPEILSTTPASCKQDNGTAVMSDLTMTYTWDNGYVGNNPTNLTAGEHQVTVTDPGSGCINVIEVVIEEFTVLSASPTINAQPNAAAADGSVTIDVFNGSFDYVYEWPDGVGPATRDDLEAGVYSVTVTDQGITGCMVVVNFVLTNNSSTNINITANPNLTCVGDNNGTVDFNITPAGADVTVEIINTNTGEVVNNGELTAGSYCMTATDNVTGDLVAGDCFEVTAPNQIDVDFASFAQTCNGLGSIEVVDIMGGNGGYSYDWSGVPGSNVTMNQDNLADGSYSVIVTDAAGCTAAATIPVADEGMPIEIELMSQVQPACPNSGDGEITVEGSGGTEPYSYVWNNIPGNGTLPNLDQGAYTVVVTDANGCSATQTLNLDALGALGLVTPSDTAVCGDEITLSAFAASADNYEWVNLAGQVIGNGPTVTLPVGVNPDTITVNASNAAGCTAMGSFALSGDALEVETNPTAMACLGESTPLGNLIVNPDPTYTWDWMPDALIESGDGTPNPVFISSATGTESISVAVANAAGCTDTLYFEVETTEINITPTITTERNCEELTVSMSVPSNYPGAQWNFGDGSPIVMGNEVTHTYTEDGNFNVSVTFDPAIACANVMDELIEVAPAPVNNIDAGPDQNVCSTELVTLNASGANGADISWLNEDGTEIGTGESVDVQALAANYYDGLMVIVEANNTEFNCTSSDTIFIFNDEIQALIAPVSTICEDDDGNAQAELSPNSGQIDGFQWSSDNADITFENGVDPDMTVFSNANDGDLLILEAFNEFCSFTDTAMTSVLVFNDDNVGVTNMTDTVALGEEATFEVFNPEGFDITWVENEVSGGEPTYSATPDEEGQVSYTVTFTDPETLCSTERTVVVTVVANCGRENLFFPNLFTPNDDGMNDVLYLRGVFVDEVFFAVYDRWGEKVFESNAIDQGWDGTYKGEKLCNDVYGYYLRVTCNDGEEYFQQGNVTLMR